MLPPQPNPLPLALTLLLLFLAPPAAAQPSFDCTQATIWAEQVICTTPTLADLDIRIADAYQNLRSAVPEDALDLRDDQRRWLTTRDACEGQQPALNCLEETMAFRLLTLDSRLIVAAPPSCEETLAVAETTFVDRYSLSTLSTVSALYHRATCLRWHTTDQLLAGGASDTDLEAFDTIRDGLYQLLSAWYQFDTLAAGGGTMFQIFLADRTLATETFLADLARPDPNTTPPSEATLTGLRQRLAKQTSYLHSPAFEILFEETDAARTQWRQAQADHQQAYLQVLAATEGHSPTFTFHLLLHLDRTLQARQAWLDTLLAE